MLTVKSFLRDAEGAFIPVGRAAFTVPDPDYVEGALEVSVDGVEILSLTHWDYVDQLWSYIINMLEKLRDEGCASTGLPDQPIELKFSKKGASRILVQSVCRGKAFSAMVSESELASAFRDAGVEFYARMEQLVPQSAGFYSTERARLLANCEMLVQ